MTTRKQYLLRVDPALWAEIERWAAYELRSANAQVEWILRDALRRRQGRRPDDGAPPGGPTGTRPADPNKET